MQCTRCGRSALADARFCDACGAPVERHDGAPTTGLTDTEHFVGRQRELGVLDGLLTRALAASGGTAAIAGEPGIGKTRTAERLAERASARGMQVYWGRCNEEPGAPPYWAWQQLLQAWLAASDDATLRQVVGRYAQTLSEIVPELLEPIDGDGRAAATAAVDAAQARFRLFDAVVSFWKRAAASAPLLLVFDNLHWADGSSLRLLEFMASAIGASRLLVLVTYRDIELTRQHPLSATLGELARQPGFERLRLTGLGRTETAGVMRLAGARALAPALVDAIHDQTEGNPLFIGEVTRLLLQEAHADASPADPAGLRNVRLLRIPEGIKDAIGRRLNRLSEPTNRVLAAASVIGRRFDLRLLSRLLCDADDPGCAQAIEQALQARVVESLREPGHYQFSHALFRETLYDEIPGPQRSRLHHQLVTAIEALNPDNPDHQLPLLAHHQWAALPGGDVARAVDYAQRAGPGRAPTANGRMKRRRASTGSRSTPWMPAPASHAKRAAICSMRSAARSATPPSTSTRSTPTGRRHSSR